MSPQFRTALYFFFQFFSGGAFHAYGGIYFASLGFSANQIGFLNTFPTFIVLIIGLFFGRIADRAKDWRQVLVLVTGISFLFSCGIVFAREYWIVLAFWSVALIAQTMAVPVADGAATFLTKQGRGQVGTFRALSTLGYIFSLFGTTYFILGFGGAMFGLLFATLSLLRFAGAVAMPNFKSPEEQAVKAPGLKVFQLLGQAWLTLPLLGWAIVYSTLQVLNSFLALILKVNGISTDMIGWLFATGAIAEAIVFFFFRHVADRFDLRVLILISCAVSVMRWVAMTQDQSLVALFFLQSLHGITYALGFIACVTYISKHTPTNNAAEAQTLFNVMQLVSAIVTITLFGGLMEAYGKQAFWGSAAIALLGVVIVLSSFRTRAPTAPVQQR